MKIALAAGHHNWDGGNALEVQLVGGITAGVAAALRQGGAEVRVVTPDEGRGTYSGGLSSVAARVVAWHREGWQPDIFLEVHTEGLNNTTVRGCFSIYPAAVGDIDTDVRDRLGPAIARSLARHTDIPVRGTGVMSEQDTYVGRQGYRLGIFSTTSVIKATCSRLIVEFGSHTNPLDLALLRSPSYPDKAGRAVAEAVLGLSGSTAPPPPTITFPTGITLRQDFGVYAYWNANGGVEVFGYPVTNELSEGGLTVQYFERARLEVHPSGIRRGLVGRELAEVRGYL